jgi:hypothetical protein
MSASSKLFKYLLASVRHGDVRVTMQHVLVSNVMQGLSFPVLEPVHKVLCANEFPVQFHLFGLFARVNQVLQERQLSEGLDLWRLFKCRYRSTRVSHVPHKSRAFDATYRSSGSNVEKYSSTGVKNSSVNFCKARRISSLFTAAAQYIGEYLVVLHMECSHLPKC